jgi:hypothetical protein
MCIKGGGQAFANGFFALFESLCGQQAAVRGWRLRLRLGWRGQVPFGK